MAQAADHNCGIYRIVNTRNGKFYVGSSKNLRSREKSHFNNLRLKKHHNAYLQYAYNKESETFSFEVLVYCREDMLIPFEQMCIDTLAPEYNGSKIAGRVEVTPEIRQKISAANKGKVGCWKGIKGTAHPSFGRTDMQGEKNPRYGTIGSMRGVKGPAHPRYGKSSAAKGKKGLEHPCYGKVGAWKNVRGEKHPTAKLTQEQANEIRELAVTKTMKQKQIAERYNISIWLVQQIKANKSYLQDLKDR